MYCVDYDFHNICYCSGMGSPLSCSAPFFALRVQRHVCLCWYFSGTSFLFKSKLSDTEVKQKSVHFFLGLFLVENHLYFQGVQAQGQASILLKLIKKQFLPPGWTKAQLLVGGQFCPFWGCKSTPSFPQSNSGTSVRLPLVSPICLIRSPTVTVGICSGPSTSLARFPIYYWSERSAWPASQQCGHYTRHYVILIVEWGQ